MILFYPLLLFLGAVNSSLLRIRGVAIVYKFLSIATQNRVDLVLLVFNLILNMRLSSLGLSAAVEIAAVEFFNCQILSFVIGRLK